MKLASLCVTCPNNKSGFCGTLLGSASEIPNARRQPGWQRFTAARAGEQIVARDQVPDDIFVLCRGWAFRYFQLSDGRRQILKFLLPGDLFSSAAIFEETPHFSVKALTGVQINGFARSELRTRCFAEPAVQSTVGQTCVAEARDAAEFLAVLGQCSAEQRIAYLLLHLMRRIAAGQVIREQRYPFPLRQQHIADTVGLTSVHVSRVLGLFRDRRIVVLSEGVLEVFNLPELERIGSLK
ncbi:transcriptional activatory protein AadR [mine drainage metagenome]|uniref:Transcriptional activatory protein AadR n=1 Tax=mine drainage metagenome TaxID=410659 RepID=A0A1J5P7P1_9ZZZZ